MTALLSIEEMAKTYEVTQGGIFGRKHPLRAVSGVTLKVEPGQSVGLVGESGCGKSTLAKVAAGFVTPSEGRVEIEGQALRDDRGRMRPGRRRVQMVFQDPLAALDARMSVAAQIDEAVRLGGATDVPAERRRLMAAVGLGQQFDARFPHELSGGQRQRVVIARALAARPRLLICDEPLAALDVSVQAQMLALLADLQRDFGLSLLFISHQLATVRALCDEVAVMYAGRIVEQGSAAQIFDRPAHPYTAMLLSTTLDPRIRRPRAAVAGEPPDPANLPSGCAFRPRCPRATELCARTRPELGAGPSDGRVACHHPLTP
ncbi:MAG: ABC transporter ATP-binding protein [Pseudooceanicola sp.]|nr:ABC transporter ATP-binding protein [Pseudooceanicola sp.]